MKNRWWLYVALVGVNLLYACVGIFSKSASLYPFLSWQYVLWFAGAVMVMGVYAVCWQQVLKRMELSVAYMFKGTSLVFGLLFCYFIWNEPITLKNILGAAIIICGIALYARE